MIIILQLPNFKVLKKENNRDVEDIDATETLKNNFMDFLTFVATHCPSGFINIIMRESSSFDWIIKRLHETYDLETRGENFLKGNDIKFEFSNTFTYQQAYITMKDFYTNSLLKKGDVFNGKRLSKDEELTPMAENFIIEKTLLKIDSRLPDHIKNSRGYLFTEDRPTLTCNQKILFSQIDMMLAEMDGTESESASINFIQSSSSTPISQNYIRQSNPRSRFRGNFRGGFRGGFFPQRPQRFQTRPPIRMQQRTFQQPYQQGRGQNCDRCWEARRFDAAKCHDNQNCPFPVNQNNSGFKVLLVQDNQNPADHYHQEPTHNNNYSEVSYYDAVNYDNNFGHVGYSTDYYPEDYSNFQYPTENPENHL